MALSKLSHIEHLFQDISERFNRTNYSLSTAWAELEHTREALQQLRIMYRATLEEQTHNQKRQNPYDLERSL